MKSACLALLLNVATAPLPAWASGATASAGSPKVKKVIELQKAPLSNQDLDEIGAKGKVLQALLSKEEAMFAERQKSYEPLGKNDALLQTVNHGTAEQTQAEMEKLVTKEKVLRGLASKEEALFAERQNSYKPLAKKGALLQTEVHATAEQTQAETEKLAKKRQMLEALASKEEAMFAERQRSYRPLVKTGAALLQTVSHANAEQTQAEMEKLAKKEKMLQGLEGQEEAAFANRQKSYQPLAKKSVALLQTGNHVKTEQGHEEIEKLAMKEKMLQSLESKQEAMFAERQRSYEPLAGKGALLQTVSRATAEHTQANIVQLAKKEKALQRLVGNEEALFAERQKSYKPLAKKGALLQTEVHATAEQTQADMDKLAKKKEMLEGLASKEEAMFAERQRSYKPLVKTGAALLQAEVHATAEQMQADMAKLAKKKQVLEGLASKEEAMFADRQRSYKPLAKTGSALLQTVSRAAAKQTQAEMDKLAKKEKNLQGLEKQEEATFAERQKTYKPLAKTSGAFLQTVSHATAEETQAELEKLVKREKVLQSLESQEEAAFANRQNSYQPLAKTA